MSCAKGLMARTLECGCYYGERVMLCPSHQPDVSHNSAPSMAQHLAAISEAVKLERREIAGMIGRFVSIERNVDARSALESVLANVIGRGV
jgi:hypothetical protein